MKILWRKRGFTTNSSGSYEWLPNATTTAATTTASTVASSALPTTTPANSVGLAGHFDLLILVAAILTGLTSIVLLVRDMLSTNKKKSHAANQKR